LFFLNYFLLIFIIHPKIVIYLPYCVGFHDVETALIQLHCLVGQVLQGGTSILENAFGLEPDLPTVAAFAAHFELEGSGIHSLNGISSVRNVTIVNDTVDFVKLARTITQSHVACHEALREYTAFDGGGLMVEELGLLIELRHIVFLLYHCFVIFCHLLCQCNEIDYNS